MMKIVTVIPLKKNIWRDNLSYFTAQDVPLGSLVTVPNRNGQMDALVIDSRPVNDLKSELKTTAWQWKKLTRVKKPAYLSPEFIKAVQIVSEYFAGSESAVAKSALPQAVLDDLPEIKTKLVNQGEPVLAEVMALQEGPEERLARYKSLIREAFAKKQSVYFCLPTEAALDRLAEPLARGIENYTLIGHGGLNKREQVEFWRRALTIEHPVLIIATPLFFALPRPDLATIVIEEESSPAYKMAVRPFLDWRLFAEELARQKKIRLILGDQALRSETVYRLGVGEISALGTLKYRLNSTATSQIIDERKSVPQNFAALDQRTIDSLENALDRQEKFFIYVNRRGLTPITLCRDCGTVMACEVCHSPLAIHKTARHKKAPAGERIFICHKCGQVVEIEDRCANCQGERLTLVGAGTEKVLEEIATLFPAAEALQLDSDTAKTTKRAKEIAKRFAHTPGAIMVGTELALNHLVGPIDHVAAVGLDAFLSRPDWRAGEKLFQTLLRLKRLAGKNFLLQTRQPEEKIFSYLSTGNLIDFYRDEIADRKTLGYPPFKVLIKISLAGKPAEISREMKKLSEWLAPWEPLVYPGLTKNILGLPILNLLLRLPGRQAGLTDGQAKSKEKTWPLPDVVKILKSLPPNFIVEVDPPSVL